MQALPPAWLLLTLALTHTAMACGQLGVVDQVSGDGQSITSRKVIALRQQAMRHGGYDQAVLDMERIREDLASRTPLSASVRRRLELDLVKDIGQLRCWSSICAGRAGGPDCPF